jgi:hypothetical protein
MAVARLERDLLFKQVSSEVADESLGLGPSASTRHSA